MLQPMNTSDQTFHLRHHYVGVNQTSIEKIVASNVYQTELDLKEMEYITKIRFKDQQKINL